MRWLLYFLLTPLAFLLGQWAAQSGLPRVDVGALSCVFLAVFAPTRVLHWLLLGAAIGRALVEPGPLPLQVLTLGLPTALLVPFRVWLFGQRWWWQVVVAGLSSWLVPWLAQWGELWCLGAPREPGSLLPVVLAAGWLPLLLALLRRLPPLRAFVERTG